MLDDRPQTRFFHRFSEDIQGLLGINEYSLPGGRMSLVRSLSANQIGEYLHDHLCLCIIVDAG